MLGELEHTEHFRVVHCPQCRTAIRVHCLQMYCDCTDCGTRSKLRGFAGMGTEIADVIDAVLTWMGTGEGFDATMHRHREIHELPEPGIDDENAPG